MFHLIYLGLVILYFYVVILVIPNVKRGVHPPPPPILWSAAFTLRNYTLLAVLLEWVKYLFRLLILTPKLVSEHVETEQPPQQILHEVTNKELERIVEQAGERANQARFAMARDEESKADSSSRQRKRVAHKKGVCPVYKEKENNGVRLPPDNIVHPSQGEKETKITEINDEQSGNQMMEGSVGTKSSESSSEMSLKSCSSSEYSKGNLVEVAQVVEGCENNTERGSIHKRDGTSMYGGSRASMITEENLEGPELVIYRGELMSPLRKVTKSKIETRRTSRSMSCPSILMEPAKMRYSPADTLEAINDILALPFLARETILRRRRTSGRCSAFNSRPLTHFPNRTAWWGSGIQIDFDIEGVIDTQLDSEDDDMGGINSPFMELPKLWVVLDVDECLIHSNFCTVGAGKRYHQMEARPDTVSQVNTVFIDMDDGEAVLVNQRPGLINFLEALADEFNVAAFTAGEESYASRVLDAIDPDNRIFSKRLFRQHCHAAKGGIFVKDLRCVEELELSRAVLVDNSPLSFIFQPNNGILVSSWFDDAEDSALNSVLQLLRYLAIEDDVRPVLQDLFGLETILKNYREYVANNSEGTLKDVESWEKRQPGIDSTLDLPIPLGFDDLSGSEHLSGEISCSHLRRTYTRIGDFDNDDRLPLRGTLRVATSSSLPIN